MEDHGSFHVISVIITLSAHDLEIPRPDAVQPKVGLPTIRGKVLGVPRIRFQMFWGISGLRDG